MFCSLRHSYISHALKRLVPVKALALATGTSMSMIERHYAKFIVADQRRYAAIACPELGLDGSGAEVVRLGARSMTGRRRRSARAWAGGERGHDRLQEHQQSVLRPVGARSDTGPTRSYLLWVREWLLKFALDERDGILRAFLYRPDAPPSERLPEGRKEYVPTAGQGAQDSVPRARVYGARTTVS